MRSRFSYLMNVSAMDLDLVGFDTSVMFNIVHNVHLELINLLLVNHIFLKRSTLKRCTLFTTPSIIFYLSSWHSFLSLLSYDSYIVFYRLSLDILLFQVPSADSVYWDGIHANPQLQTGWAGNTFFFPRMEILLHVVW